MNPIIGFLVFLLPLLTDASFRIIGGAVRDITSAPYLVGIENKVAHRMCVGAIISPIAILTAAHCFKDVKSATDLQITIGSNNFKPPGTYKTKDWVIHPSYDENVLNYDVAILRLQDKLSFSDKIQQAKLPSKDDNIAAGTEGIVSGWGNTDPSKDSPSPVLRSTNLKVKDQKACDEILKKNNLKRTTIDNSFFCAVDDVHHASPCFGDSGSPFITDDKTVRGIVSGLLKCGSQGIPVIFEKTSFVLDFITKNL